MYELPADFDAGVFVGRELIQVSFTINTVHLVFEDELAITLEASFLVRERSSTEEVEQAPPVERSSLPALVGRRVRQASTPGGGTLVLVFEGGGSLTCLEDSKIYESYRIQVRGREIIV